MEAPDDAIVIHAGHPVAEIVDTVIEALGAQRPPGQPA